MLTLNKKSILSNSVSKFINKLFKLSDIRKVTSNDANNYVKILRPKNKDPWDKVAQSEEFDTTVKHRDWAPLFRFDMPKVVQSIFGSIDIDFQNLYNSYNAAKTSVRGVVIRTNNFNNITAERRNNNTNFIAANLNQHVCNFMSVLERDFNSLRYEVYAPEQINWDISTLSSCNAVVRKNKNMTESQVQNHISSITNKLRELFNNGMGLGHNRQNGITDPSAVLFEIDGTEPSYSYGMGGNRTSNIPHNSVLRCKNGLYLALNLGDYNGSHWSSTEADLPEYIRDIIDTGIFGSTYSVNATSVAYVNTLILRVTRRVFPTRVNRNSNSHRNPGSDAPFAPQGFANEQVCETHGVDGGAYASCIAVENLQNTHEPFNILKRSVTFGPLAHVIHPESFRNFVVSEPSFADDKNEEFAFKDHSANKQEWLQLKDASGGQCFSHLPSKYVPVMEPKNSNPDKIYSILEVTKGKGVGRELNSTLPTDSYRTYPTESIGGGSAMTHTPLFGWVCYNAPTSNLPTLITSAFDERWISRARPIPGPIGNKEVIGMVTTLRNSPNLNKDTRVKWAWQSSRRINPEVLCTDNLKECLMDYEITIDEKERGKGKIYVDQDDIAYCPLTGDALMCSTFMVGCDDPNSTWRSSHPHYFPS